MLTDPANGTALNSIAIANSPEVTLTLTLILVFFPIVSYFLNLVYFSMELSMVGI
jgi:hypothetical protein